MTGGRSLASLLSSVFFLSLFWGAEVAAADSSPAPSPPAESASPAKGRDARAPLGAPTLSGLVDHREVIVPVGSGERLRVDNPLGHVVVRAWPHPGEIHIIAEKHAATDEQLHRLRVHYLAWAGGDISVDTRVDLGGRERSVPLSGSRIDLVLEVPAGLEVEAKTFGGDLRVSGLRAGARLETTGGRIEVSDVRGNVVTHQLRGGQQVAAVEGDVELDGVEGTMDLQGLGGGHLDARLIDGSIRAEDIRSDAVRLVTTTGDIVFVGLLRPARRYDLRTYEGNVVLFPGERPMPFDVRARASEPLASSLPLRVLSRAGKQVRAIVSGGGQAPAERRGAAETEHAWTLSPSVRHPAREEEPRADARPIVELSAPLGLVMIVSTRTDLPARP